MTLVYLTLAWCAGLVLASLTAAASPAWWIIAGLAGVGIWLVRRVPARRFVFLCLLAAALGALRYDAARPAAYADENHLAAFNDTGWVTFTGTVVAPPDVRDRQVNLRVAADWVFDAETPDWEQSLLPQPVEGVALVQAPRYGRYAAGDRVEVRGMPHTPPVFDTFSYHDYLARQGVHSVVSYAIVEVTGSEGAHPLFALREKAQALISGALPEPAASLLTGILLGVESGISPGVRDDFNAVGATHIIAISGFNMSVLALVITRVLEKALPSKRAAAGAGIVGIAVYTVFVGAGGAVLRAAIMSSLLIVAPLVGRRTYVPASLAFAALCMTAANPFALWDVGFQLSVAAVLGMALFVEPLERGFRRALAPFFATTAVERLLGVLSEPLIVTLAAQVTTIPLLALYFGRLSFASFFVNFLIIPVQTPLMLLGALAVIVGLALGPGPALPLFWLDWLFIGWTVAWVRLFARFDWASVAVEVDGRAAALFYAALLAGMVWAAVRPSWLEGIGAALRRRAVRLGAMGLAAALVALMAITLAQQPDGRLHVAFLDVGGGHAVFIATPGGAHILVDGGAYPATLLAALGDRMPFWDREIELLVITQPKETQISALPALLERYTVGAVLTTGQPGGGADWQALQAALADTATVEAAAGYTATWSDGVSLAVLHPAARPAEADEPNEYGMALRLSYGDAAFLLMPDLVDAAETAMVRSGQPLRATVLQLAFQGSAQATGKRFLEAVDPQAAVVQVGVGNRQGYPAPEVLEKLEARGVPLFRTDRSGAIDITTDGRTLWIATAR
ncbi:MAG: ComEC/Rec2 family competence protein [Anaerolineae bacterium]|nr:ComEC/Rec2 family competence protein [Anaerolineae bacterium]